MKARYIVLTTMFIMSASCTGTQDGDILDTPADITLSLSGADTKSRISDTDRISEMTVAVFNPEGILETTCYSEGTSITLRLDRNRSHNAYIIANLGDRTSSIPDTEDGMDGFKAIIPSYAHMVEKGLPGAGMAVIHPGWNAGQEQQVALNRLAAKLNIDIDISEIGDDLKALEYSLISVRNLNRSLTLFPSSDSPSSRAESTDDFLPDFDYDDLKGTVTSRNVTRTVTLIVPENISGSNDGFATYVELSTRKKANTDGVKGGLCYRFHVSDDNDIIGGESYHINLRLTWEGMFTEESWQVCRDDDWSDTRRLFFSDSGDFKQTSVINICPGSSADTYVYYSHDGHMRDRGRRSTFNNYPYGWQLFLDDKQISKSTTSGSIGSAGISWNIDDTDDRITFNASSTARSGTEIRLRAESFDERHSCEATLRVTRPLTASWESEPKYVAQQGILRATGAEGTDIVHYSLEEGNGIIRLNDNGDGSATISTTGAGTAIIRMECADSGQEGFCTVSVRKPVMLPGSGLQSGAITLHPDGTEVRCGIAFVSEEGESISFSPALYDEFLAPVFTTQSGYVGIAPTDDLHTVFDIFIARLHLDGKVVDYRGDVFDRLSISTKTPGCAINKVGEIFIQGTDPFPANFRSGKNTFYGTWHDYSAIMATTSATLSSTAIENTLGNEQWPICIPNISARAESISYCGTPAYIHSDDAASLNLSISRNTGYTTLTPSFTHRGRHAAGKVWLMGVVSNKHSQSDTIRAAAGYINIFLHGAAGTEITRHVSNGSYSVPTGPSGTGTTPKYDKCFYVRFRLSPETYAASNAFSLIAGKSSIKQFVYGADGFDETTGAAFIKSIGERNCYLVPLCKGFHEKEESEDYQICYNGSKMSTYTDSGYSKLKKLVPGMMCLREDKSGKLYKIDGAACYHYKPFGDMVSADGYGFYILHDLGTIAPATNGWF
ncbi:MAG: hypothetical protein IK143_04790 [Bacteroidales bacterium]|nr:hypothetical protein [Bacteroidales bacterium]